jgi:hypothetical protein
MACWFGYHKLPEFFQNGRFLPDQLDKMLPSGTEEVRLELDVVDDGGGRAVF